MRQILVDWARKNRAGKRGGGAVQVPLDEIVAMAPGKAPEDLIALDEALTELSVVDARKAKIIELRFFGGMKLDEVAQCLSISTATVERDARLAQAWLCRQMTGGAPA